MYAKIMRARQQVTSEDAAMCHVPKVHGRGRGENRIRAYQPTDVYKHQCYAFTFFYRFCSNIDRDQ